MGRKTFGTLARVGRRIAMRKQYNTLTMLVLASLFTMTLSVPQVQASILIGTVDPNTNTVAETKFPENTPVKVIPEESIVIVDDAVHVSELTKQSEYNIITLSGDDAKVVVTGGNVVEGKNYATPSLAAAYTIEDVTPVLGNKVVIEKGAEVLIAPTADTDSPVLAGGYAEAAAAQANEVIVRDATLIIAKEAPSNVLTAAVLAQDVKPVNASLYGGAGNNLAQDNTVSLTDVNINENTELTIAGGYIHDEGSADKNEVSLTNLNLDPDSTYISEVAGGNAYNGTANENTVAITQETAVSVELGDVYGGYTYESTANNYTVTLTGTEITSAGANTNGLTPEKSLRAETVTGGDTWDEAANENTVSLTQAYAYTVIGGTTGNAVANGNEVSLTQSFAGWTTGGTVRAYSLEVTDTITADANKVTGTDNSMYMVFGGHVEGNGFQYNYSSYQLQSANAILADASDEEILKPTLQANENHVDLKNGTVYDEVYGGLVDTGFGMVDGVLMTTAAQQPQEPSVPKTIETYRADSNNVHLENMDVSGNIYGGKADKMQSYGSYDNSENTLHADTNTVELMGGTAAADITGGEVSTDGGGGLLLRSVNVAVATPASSPSTYTLAADGNEVHIKGTTVNGSIYGGKVTTEVTTWYSLLRKEPTAHANNNKITLADATISYDPPMTYANSLANTAPVLRVARAWQSPQVIIGGYTPVGEASANSVELTNANVSNDQLTIYGGLAPDTASQNRVAITGTTDANGAPSIQTGNLYGGKAGNQDTAYSYSNGERALRLTTDSEGNGTYTAGIASAGNDITLTNVHAADVYGGKAEANTALTPFDPDGNDVVQQQLKLNSLSATVTAAVNGNNASLTNSQADTVYGGTVSGEIQEASDAAYYLGVDSDQTKLTLDFQANENTVTLHHATIGSVWGGYTASSEQSSTPIFNSVILRAVIANPAYYEVSAGSANDNQVYLDQDAIVTDLAVGGEAAAGTADRNLLSLNGVSVGPAAGEATPYPVTPIYKWSISPASANFTGTLLAGGIAHTGEASANTVQIKNTALNSQLTHILGGWGNTHSDSNTLDLALASTAAADNQVIVAAGIAEDGHANDNTLTLTDTGSGTYHTIIGGLSKNDLPAESTYGASGNTVTVSGITMETSYIDEYVADRPVIIGLQGGRALAGDATGNTLQATNSDLTLTVGGYAEAGNATGNTVRIIASQADVLADGTLPGFVAGGMTRMGSEASGNYVTVTDHSDIAAIEGGYASLGNAAGNSVYLANSHSGLVVGGGTGSTLSSLITESLTYEASTMGDAKGNEVLIDADSTVDKALGGISLDLQPQSDGISASPGVEAKTISSGNALNNTVTLKQGTVTTSIVGGFSQSGQASGNTLNLYSGTAGTTDATANSSSLNIDPNLIAGGYAMNGAATGNTVNVYGSKLGTMMSLYGGYSLTDSRDNTLNMYTKDNTVQNLDYFQNLNFYVPEDTVANETLLTVTDTADVSNAAIQAGIQQSTKLSPGEHINVIYDAKGLATDGATYHMMPGLDKAIDTGFVLHQVRIHQQDPYTIVLDIPENDQPALHPDTKLIPEERTAAISRLNNAADFALTNAYDGALAAWEQNEVKAKFAPYIVLGGHDPRTDTGSYIDTQGFNGNLGFVRRTYHETYADTIMPFVEYGNGNYTAHLDNGARADGDQHYTGAGLLVRRDKTNGLHYEAMLRAGRLDSDFHTQILGYQASYDTNTPYISAHLGLGKLFQKRNNSTYDIYTKFLWTHLASDTVTLHSGLGNSQYNLDSVNAYTARLGFRWTKTLSPSKSYYAGLAWNYEFGDNAKAHYGILETPTAGAKGSSALFELGWQSQITKENPWGAKIQVTAWTGIQKGLTYSATISRAF